MSFQSSVQVYQWSDNFIYWYFWTPFPISSVKQLLVRFLQHWESPPLLQARQLFINIALFRSCRTPFVAEIWWSSEIASFLLMHTVCLVYKVVSKKCFMEVNIRNTHTFMLVITFFVSNIDPLQWLEVWDPCSGWQCMLFHIPFLYKCITNQPRKSAGTWK